MARLTMIKAAAAAEKAAQKAAQSNTKREPAPPGNIWISEDKLAELYPTVNKDGRTLLPGFGPPVNYMPDHDGGAERFGDTVRWVVNRCPNALQDWAPEPLTVRERNMMQIINALTDKPDWRRKVFDETILAKWRAEAVTEEGQGFTEKMFDSCVAELQEKAGQHIENDLVSVLDSEWAVVKSESIISEELKEELKNAVAPLEDVPVSAQDWHPGSNNQVLDLVHPSLFPLIYGRSRVLPTSTTTLDDCIQTSGKGEIVPVPDEDDCKLGNQSHWLGQIGTGETDYWSNRFQWLPSDIAFTEGESVEIKSYINNLHPVHHRSIYPVIEKFIAKSISAWDLVLSSYVCHGSVERLRVPMTGTEYDFPLGEEAPEDVGKKFDENDDMWWDVREQWVSAALALYQGRSRNTKKIQNTLVRLGYPRDGLTEWVKDNRVLIKPDAREFGSFNDDGRCEIEPLNLRSHFKTRGIQVIVKLANIHLTPENPTYAGGSWHIEGKLNEHICATSLYYYDNTNITESHLAFRTKVSTDEITQRDYAQDDNEGVCYLFDIERNGPGIQKIGKVATNEGRLLAFPNVLQHQVQPFSLADPTKPGHRKILALFLVDPFQRVISTANVPPQQREWWAEAVQGLEGKLDQLPPELRHQVMTDVGDFPISLEEARGLRQELMDERRAFVEDVNNLLESEDFSFCEH